MAGDACGKAIFLTASDRELAKGDVQSEFLNFDKQSYTSDHILYILTKNGFWHYKSGKLFFLTFNDGIRPDRFSDLKHGSELTGDSLHYINHHCISYNTSNLDQSPPNSTPFEVKPPQHEDPLFYCRLHEVNLRKVYTPVDLSSRRVYPTLLNLQFTFFNAFNHQVGILQRNTNRPDLLNRLAQFIADLAYLDYVNTKNLANNPSNNNIQPFYNKTLEALRLLLNDIDEIDLSPVEASRHCNGWAVLKAILVVFTSLVLFAGSIALVLTNSDTFSFDLFGLALSEYSNELVLAAHIVGGLGIASGVFLPAVIRKVSEMSFFTKIETKSESADTIEKKAAVLQVSKGIREAIDSFNCKRSLNPGELLESYPESLYPQESPR